MSRAQTRFYADVPVKQIGRNENMQVSFTVENANQIDQINPPTFKNFTIVSGPFQQTSMTAVNGNVKRTVSLQYILQPLLTGKLQIGSAFAIADGKKIYSDPVVIEVNKSSVPASQNHPANSNNPYSNLTIDELGMPATTQFDDYILKKGENVEEKIKKNLFVKVDVNKRTCFVGEPLIVAYKLYSRLKSESNLAKAPSFNGFSVSELGRRDNFSLTTEKFNGREYNVYLLRKVQLYPLQSGTQTLGPVDVDNKVTFIKANAAGNQTINSLFDMMRTFADDGSSPDDIVQKDITVKNDPVIINVLPLPEQYKPLGFKGAVGVFSIKASVDKSTLSTDDIVKFTLTVQGAGNMSMINAPQLSLPQGAEPFEPEMADTIDAASVPMKGSKSFTYPVVINAAGSYIFPAVEFSFFDPESKSYQTVSTKPISVQVAKGSGKKMNNSNITKDNLSKGISENKWILIGGGALLVLLVFWFIKKDNEQKSVVSIRKSTPIKVVEKQQILTSNPLQPAAELLGSSDAGGFYRVLDECLRNYLCKKLKISAEDYKSKKVIEVLDRCNVGIGTTLMFTNLMQRIEMNLYTPLASSSEMENDYEKAAEVVGLLEKQIC
ncbi:BatD family protein [soil metagenome]